MRIVLVRPRDPNNVGAAARAMANFGFSDLVVVAPHPPVWEEVRSAVGAGEVIARARVVGSLAEAVADRALVGGTTAGSRRRLARPVSPEVFFGGARGEGAWERTALVFGNEKHGLTNDDLALCGRIVRIETAAAQPSLNLAHAVAVCCYEAARTSGPVGGALPIRIPRGEPRATSEAIESLVAEVAVLAGSRRGAEAGGRAGAALRDLLLRAGATAREVDLLRGLVAPKSRS
jgi:tRNA/rRNA methyltransferase